MSSVLVTDMPAVDDNTILDIYCDVERIHAWLDLKRSQQTNGWYVHPRIVYYTGLKHKRNGIASIKKNSRLTGEDFERQISNFERLCTVQTALTKIIKKGAIYFISAPVYANEYPTFDFFALPITITSLSF
jgi:hypothetical protein